MESGFGDYNLTICGLKHVIQLFQIQDGAKYKNKMAVKIQNLHQNGQFATLKLYKNG